MTPRAYQVECATSVFDAFQRGLQRVYYVLPTGCGKTVTFVMIAEQMGAKVLVLAHRKELLDQACKAFRSVSPDFLPQVEQGGRKAGRFANVVAASVPTLVSGERLQWFKPDLVVVDETHHVPAKSWTKVIEGLGCFDPGGPKLVGCTATPARADSKSLDGIYEERVYEYPLREAIEAGYLCDIRGFRVKTETNLATVKSTAGDFNRGDLERAVDVDERTLPVIRHWQELAADRPTLVFCAGVNHARHVAEAFRAKGVISEHVDGTMKDADRDDVIRRFKRGEIQVVTNDSVLTEGFDYPAVSCIVMMRPTKSWGLYCLDAETEVLTSHGWRGIGQVKPGDCVPALDMESGKGKWVGVTGYVERPMSASEKWVEYHGPRSDFRVTDQHRMIYSTKTRRGWFGWKVGTAEEMAAVGSSVRMPTAVEIDQPGVPLSDAELYFIGMMMTDGSWTTHQATIYQSERYPQVIERIEKCLQDCGLPFSRFEDACVSSFNAGYKRWRYCIPVLARDGGGCRHLIPYLDKNIATALMAMSKRQFIAMLIGIHDGDGYKKVNVNYTTRSWSICSARKEWVDRLQALAAIHGFTASISEQGVIYVITITPKDWRSVGGGDGRPNPEVSPATSERVWCVQTETGTIITRRKGKVTVMGNCQMVGRGTRLCDGKDHLIVIDAVDNCGKHSLASVPALLGLPPGLDLQGKSLRDAARKMDELGDEVHQVLAEQKGLEFADLDSILEQVDLLRGQLTIPDAAAAANCKLQWVQLPDGFYVSCGSGKSGRREARLRRSRDDEPWECTTVEGGRVVTRKMMSARLTAKELLFLSDNSLRQKWPDAVSVLSDAHWRTEPATENQIKALERFRIPAAVIAAVANDRGAASKLLDVQCAKIKR